MVEGYNIAFKLNNKTLAGRTQDALTITPTTKPAKTNAKSCMAANVEAWFMKTNDCFVLPLCE